MAKKRKLSNVAPMIPAGAQFASSYSAAMKDRERFDQSQKRFQKNKIKNLKKGEH